MLADREAVGGAMGFRGDLTTLGLPANAGEAELLNDPKTVLHEAVKKVRGRRGMIQPQQIIAAIALRQDLNKLRQAASFQAFERELTGALLDLGCIA